MRWLWTFITMFVAPSVAAATWTVNTVGDAGDGVCDQTCTFRDAVLALSEDDRVLFDLTLPNPLEIDIAGPAMNISVPARITATDGVPTTLRRVSGSDRFLTLLSGADVRIVGLGFRDGLAPVPAGGGQAFGGAIRVEAGAALECRECVFRNNRAVAATSITNPLPGAAGSSAAGGAIDADGDLIVDGGAFISNRAEGAAGVSGGSFVVPGGSGGSAFGGAVAARGALDVLNSTFFNNFAIGGAGGMGGATPTPPGFAGGNGGDAVGGAVYIGALSEATIGFSTFADNRLVPGPLGLGGVNGGANGSAGMVSGPAFHADAAATLNSSVLFDHALTACAGVAATARTSNLVADASCPGQVIAGLDLEFEVIDIGHPSPAFVPKLGSQAVDTSADCLDTLGLEAVELDQRLSPRPMLGGGPIGRCDYGAIEYTEVMLRDGFEDPPPPP